jgi:hypothetical protein
VRPAAAVALALALVTALAACGSSETPAQRDAEACAGAAAGAAALHGPGADVDARVRAAEDRAAAGAHALPPGHPDDPSDAEAIAVRALLAQSLRLRLVRSQIARGTPPETVLKAAGAGLTEGDRQTRERLAAAGVRC